MNISIDGVWKRFRSDCYNYDFNMETGYFERWGKTKEEDPSYSKFGPEIADIEVSTICNMGCQFCYKSNKPFGQNMPFEVFKHIIDKFPKYNNIHLLTQVAFGIGDIDANPDLWKIMEYCHENFIISNITINGDRLTDEIVEKLVNLCGAISVSRYGNKNICYDAVEKLTEAGCKQVNIHQLISKETLWQTVKTLWDIKVDKRLEKLNAIVFLSLKRKGRGKDYISLTYSEFRSIIALALENKIKFGTDSCGANKLIQVFKEIGVLDRYKDCIEPCESCSFSSYIDVNGVFFPCSFANNECKGIDVLKSNNFLEDVWLDSTTCKERDKIQKNGRSCPYFSV